MKKVIIWACMVVILVMVTSTGFAEFDKGLFEADEAFETSYVDIPEHWMAGPKAPEQLAYADGNDIIILMPGVVIKEEGDKVAMAEMRLGLLFLSAEPAVINTLIFIVDDTIYSIGSLMPEASTWLGMPVENEVIALDEIGLAMINNMREAKAVTIQLKGDEKTIEYLLSQDGVNWFVRTYDLFVEAGGLNFEFTDGENSFPITVQ